MTQAAADAWTIGRLLTWTREFLASRSVDEPRLSAELLLASALECRKIDLYTRFDQVPPVDRIERFRALVRDAGRHTPIAYLIGRKEFYSLEFEVSPAVLIPRPETELIVEHAVALARQLGADPFHVLDIGTGSGCIAIAIARFVPAARVIATDVSPEALDVAARNAARLGVAERITFVHADAVDVPPETRPVGAFHVIASNPPYIAEDAIASLPANVRDFEPRIALAGGAEGLTVLRRIAQGARSLLTRGGRCCVEVASGQHDAVARLFEDAGWRRVATARDGAGIERMLAFESHA